MTKLWTTMAMCVVGGPAAALAAPPLKHVDVYTSGTDGYHTFRIPAIEAAADGSLVAFAEARKHNQADPGFGEQDIDLVLKRSTDGGKTWSAMKVIEDPGELWSAANPATIVDRSNGRLWVLYLRSKPGRSTNTSRPGTDDMETIARYSDDHGVKWSEPIDLTKVARDFEDKRWRASVVGPGGAIQTRKGRLVAPVWQYEPYGVFAMFSDDRGQTWRRGAVLSGDASGNECQLVELANGNLLLDIRQGKGPHRWFTTSSDGGATWSASRPGVTVSRVACAIERYTLKSAGDDRNRIVWTGPKGPGRTNLVIKTSYDEGKTFVNERLIWDQAAAYSDLTILEDKSVGVLWERGEKKGYAFITFTRLTREFIDPPINYDEAKVPRYTLPDPLMMQDGTKVTDAQTWRTRRRAEILELFRTHVYGRAPKRPEGMTFEVFDTDGKALEATATRKQVSVHFSGKKDGPSMDILVYLPNAAPRPVSTFVILNFYGNHSIHPDPAIRLSTRWMRGKGMGIVNNRATEASRGARASRFPVEKILARGYGLATIYYGDIDPDFHDGFKNGVHGALDKAGGAARPPDAWGAIGAWAWGLSRAMDYFETDADIDHKRVGVLGHSRLGKTSLWAGARDERFALVISNNSGCGGAALSRRRFGETVARINKGFPHWFCENFKKYDGREDALPVDQHMLIALSAPRPVYVASAEKDRWADPRGEFLSARHASGVYRLLGAEGMAAERMPELNQPVQSIIGYHIRSGGHNLSEYDWQRYMDVADRHVRNRK